METKGIENQISQIIEKKNNKNKDDNNLKKKVEKRKTLNKMLQNQTLKTMYRSSCKLV